MKVYGFVLTLFLIFAIDGSVKDKVPDAPQLAIIPPSICAGPII
jgi:hypothetical protein